jgi:hypothetical protein
VKYFARFLLRLTRSTVCASGSTSIGISGNNILVDNSEVAGDTATLSGGITVGGSKLEGGQASGAVCAGVRDESYTFSASACPCLTTRKRPSRLNSPRSRERARAVFASSAEHVSITAHAAREAPALRSVHGPPALAA